MIYFFAAVLSLLLPVFSYYLYKAYQLSGYHLGVLFDDLLSKGIPIGKKNKLKLTKRLCRAIVLHTLMCAALIFVALIFVDNVGLKVLDVFVIYLFSPLVLAIAHLILMPIEHLIKVFYINKAKKVLAKKSAKVIGITGSYGKTSTKDILTHILEKQFKVCKTPHSYNTEMGIVKTILTCLDDHDFLVAEMGARHRGDIKKLCDIAKPDICVITTIGPQHLQTFGSIETVEETKSEIISCSKKNAPVFVNCDSPSSCKVFGACRKSKFACNKQEGYAYATDIVYDSSGCSFCLHLFKDSVRVQTSLLGKHNVDNIVTAAALAYFLGVSKHDIAHAISTLQPSPHRLELIKNNSICILDDAYNSNPIGANEALKVLATFKGKRKIVVTPGFVEMGDAASESNFKLGAAIADAADYVVIMNEENKNFLLSGLISHNFNKNNIFFAANMQKQADILKNIICEGAVILFENDLPDNYR